jgi:hypothetical protein
VLAVAVDHLVGFASWVCAVSRGACTAAALGGPTHFPEAAPFALPCASYYRVFDAVWMAFLP